ncbi:MAG: sugar phosphate isomerase/epimerase [Planctomycetes bacterium]|nr:sugar phosphate isomerase/epimerase [Planctomycetota bacterium]
MAKKLSIGSWAYTFGPYTDHPVPFDKVVKKLGTLRFDGVEVGAFRPHIHPDDYPMKSDRQTLAEKLKVAGLQVSGVAADFWTGHPLGKDRVGCAPAWKDAESTYVNLFKKNLQLCLDLKAPAIRVDTKEGPDAYTKPEERQEALKQIAKVWRKCAAVAADSGVRVAWEFEPGFLFNKPSEVVELIGRVNHANFGALFDSCHAYMCAVVGARQAGEKETLPGGVAEFAGKLRGKILHVHLIDSDGTLHGNETSTHRPFGEGFINFAEVIPAIEKAGYQHPWWTIDLCFWPEAWQVTAKAKKFLSAYLN